LVRSRAVEAGEVEAAGLLDWRFLAGLAGERGFFLLEKSLLLGLLASCLGLLLCCCGAKWIVSVLW
jgi:hypothetical protein